MMNETVVENKGSAGKYVLILIVITALIRLIIAGITGLGFGESYYAMGVVHPQLSYFDQPPLSFWLSWLSVEAFSEVSAFTLRLPAVLFFAGTTWMMYLLTKKLFSPQAGFWAAVILNLSAVFTYTGAMWLQPDAPLMFFWLATALCLVKIFSKEFVSEEEKKQYRRSFRCYSLWVITGILLGFTTLSKYHAAFLFAGAGLYAITRKEDRHWVFHPGPYIALVINFIIAAPVFLWNYNHGWVSFLFQGARAANDGFSIHFDWFVRSIGGQMLWVMPWIWIPLIWQLYVCIKSGTKDKAHWFCFATAIFPIVFFTVVTLWSNLGFHFHWQAPGYMMLFPPLGAAFYSFYKKGGKSRKWGRVWIFFSLIVTTFFCIVLQIHAATGFWSFYGPKWFGHLFGEKYDPTMEGYDYDDLQQRFKKEGWLNPEKYFIASNRWWLAGKVDWALRGKLPIVAFDNDPRNIAYFFDQKKLLGKDAIFVSSVNEEQTFARIKPYFKDVYRVADQKIIRAGVVELELHLYYCKDYIKLFPLPYGLGVDEK